MSALAFDLPPALAATAPAEERGLGRDQVRLMVARRQDGSITHATFQDLPAFLRAGDVVVVNTSATIPAAVSAQAPNGASVSLHFSTRAPETTDADAWVVELRSADGSTPLHPRGGERYRLADGGVVELGCAYAGRRLWLARAHTPEPLLGFLARHGHPIRYGYIQRPWPLDAYQTVFARTPGSAEMPSAARPFSHALVTTLAARGVLVAPVLLHTGVSSPEHHEPPYPEWCQVPAATARLVNAAHGWGGRVIGAGTTVARALESAGDAAGVVEAWTGWTRLVITPPRGIRVLDGLISGWHEPRASHLDLLEAAAGEDLLRRSYAEALRQRYLWHEFGDSHLILP